jgi:small-conductance mechanosensitive channel
MPVMDEVHKVNVTHQTEERHLGGRLIDFARRRPILSLGILAGAGALGGIELAAGALLGLGAAALVATPAGRGLREGLEARARRFFEHEEHERRGGSDAPPPAQPM